MNRLSLLVLLLIVNAFLSPAEVKGQSIPDYLVYKKGEFIVYARHAMKVDFMMKNAQLKNRGNKDTLYEDDKYLFLGDAADLAGVYKKYKVPVKFSKYRVIMYKGKLAPPDFKTDTSAWLFRTQIKTQCKEKGINFAGHFTIVEWGCGSNCFTIAIVDRITGRIYHSSIYDGVDYTFDSLAYQANSSMVIMNDWMLEEFKGYVCHSEYYKLRVAKWDDSKFGILATQH